MQPQKLWVPALWEGTFASIHAYMIYNILRQDKVALTKDELRLYGMVFQRHDLEVEEFQALLKARPLAGDPGLGERYLDCIRPLVWTSASRDGFVDTHSRRRQAPARLNSTKARVS